MGLLWMLMVLSLGIQHHLLFWGTKAWYWHLLFYIFFVASFLYTYRYIRRKAKEMPKINPEEEAGNDEET